MNDFARAPVIILGMHRSGTSVVTRLLGELGLFIGARLDENYEALYFSGLNTWILKCCGGRWDTPHSINYLLDDPRSFQVTVDYIRARLAAPFAYGYLGRRWLGTRSVVQMQAPWGWKNPINTLTLPLWLALFPNARLVHVVRNGIDTAESLYRRQQRGFEEAVQSFSHHKTLVAWGGKQGWFGESPRAMRWEEGFVLWQEYLEYAERFLEPVRASSVQVRYEDFIAEPETHLYELADFCGLHVTSAQVRACRSSLRPERRYGFAADPKLVARWNELRTNEWMSHYKYDQLFDPPSSGAMATAK